MTNHQIDGTARFLAGAHARRGLIAALAGGLAAGPHLLAASDAEAKSCRPCRKRKRGRCKGKRPNGTLCGLCRECQGGTCVPLGAGVSCGPGQTCQDGACATCIPTTPGSPVCAPGPFNACCSGRCVMQQPDVFLCTG